MKVLRIASGIVLVCVCIALVASPADATYRFQLKWGGLGLTDGSFEYPAGIDVNRSSGNVYVADFNKDRVQEFTSTGNFIRAWGSKGSKPSQFDGATDLAVSPAGSVYVSDEGNNRIEKFDSTGHYLFDIAGHDGDFNSPFGVAVDGSGNVYVADFLNGRVQEFTGTGNFVRQFGSGVLDQAQSVGVDSAGDVFVGDKFRIFEFDPNDNFLRAWKLVTPDGAGFVNDIRVQANAGEFGGDAVFAVTGTWLMKYTTEGQLLAHVKILAANGKPLSFQGIGSVSPNHLFLTDADFRHVIELRTVYPNTTIDAKPELYSTSHDPSFVFSSFVFSSFVFSSSEANSTFQCSLVNHVGVPDFTACSSPKQFSNKPDGHYDFYVRAIDSQKLVDQIPALYTFYIDTTPPKTTITSGPPNGSHINNSTPTFTFTSSEAGSTFDCWHDDGFLRRCTSPHMTGVLADGVHVWRVRATDLAGNFDPTPATRTFTVDTVAPALTISSKTVTMTSQGVVTVDLTCPSDEISGPCEGTLTLKTANKINGSIVTLGSASFSIDPGQTTGVDVQLNSSNQQLVKNQGQLQVKAKAVVNDQAGNQATITQDFTLKS